MAFIKEIFQRLGTKLSFSTANHPQIDGQTERMNMLLGDILRAFVNLKQDNWAQLLPLCEFAINNSQQASTGNSPFYLNYGYNPKASADFVSGADSQGAPNDWLQGKSDALRMARDTVVAAQARQAIYADQSRSRIKYKPGDSVMVFRDFILTP